MAENQLANNMCNENNLSANNGQSASHHQWPIMKWP